MESQIIAFLMNPAVQALAIKLVADVIKKGLTKLDESKAVDEYQKLIHVIVPVLAGAAAFLTLAVKHQAAQTDVEGLLNWALQVYLSAQGVHLLGNHLMDKIKKDDTSK